MLACASRGLPRARRPLTRRMPRLQPQGSSLADKVASKAQRQCQSDVSEQQSGALEQAVEHTPSSVQAAMEPELERGEFYSCAWVMPGRLQASIDGTGAKRAREAV